MDNITAYIPRTVELESDDSDDENDLDSVYSEWSDAVNMTASQLREWSKNPCSREASKDPHAVIKRNLRLLEKNKSDWTDDDIEDAERTISFISRMSDEENKPDSPKDGANSCPTEWAISLLNWAYSPFESVPDIPEEREAVEEVSLSSVEPDGDVEALAEFEDGDAVTVDNSAVSGAKGFVLEPHDEDFNFPNPDGDGTVTIEVGDETVYEVVVDHDEYATVLATESQVSDADREDIVGDVDANLGDAAEEMDTEENAEWRQQLPGPDGEAELEEGVAELVSPADVPGISRNDVGQAPWPESWREAEEPAYLIAMDAWTSMGATFRGCRREMKGKIRNPNAFCGAYKDGIYGHTYWR